MVDPPATSPPLAAPSSDPAPSTSESPNTLVSPHSIHPAHYLSEIQNIATHVQPPTVPPHRSHNPANNLKRSEPFQFGSRYLEETDDVFEFNAWDRGNDSPNLSVYSTSAH